MVFGAWKYNQSSWIFWQGPQDQRVSGDPHPTLSINSGALQYIRANAGPAYLRFAA